MGKVNMTPADVRTEYIYREGVEQINPSKFRLEMRKIIERTYDEVYIKEQAYASKLSAKEIKKIILGHIENSPLKHYNIKDDVLTVMARCVKNLAIEVDSPEYIRAREFAISRAEEIMLGNSPSADIGLSGQHQDRAEITY